MLNNYESNVKAIITLLRLQKVKVNSTTVNETMQNHPDWPSLLCITDSLNKWNIPNGAGKIEANKIDQLPTPCIVYTTDIDTPLTIISQVTDTMIQLYQKDFNKAVIVRKEEFLKKWNGVYLIAEPNDQSGEPDYKANKRKAFSNSLAPASSLATFLIISFALINKIAVNALSPIAIYLQYLILLVGVVVTSLLLWHEIDKNNPLLKKVCTGITKGNCNAILTGKRSKVFSWLSWSEVGFFYFAGGLLTLVSFENAIGMIAWINITALPYTVFSVYYQWRVAKQWCVLCLAVQALLLLGGFNIIANNFLLSFPTLSILFFIKTIVLYLIPVFIWYTLKPYILRLQKAKTAKREYLRLKFNSQIFDTLLKKQRKITLATEGLGIDLGNAAAENTIIKVCNPYCGPCATAHPRIEEIVNYNNNVKAKIIFNTPNDQSNLSFRPVQHLLAIAALGNSETIHNALDDWYLAKKKDYEIFAAKYKMGGALEQQNIKMEKMEKWCKATGIYYTPTFFVNGYQLPDAYSIEDLEYFLVD